MTEITEAVERLKAERDFMAGANAGLMMVQTADLDKALSELTRLQEEVKGLRADGTDTIRLLTELRNIALKAHATLQGQQS